ncbi:MAG: adenosylmethionine decarboxylase [bacterium]|nr:adenosylmethionine decarboxylase [bacterium]
MKHLGIQYIAEFYQCSRSLLADPVQVEKAMLKAARLAKATIVESVFHQFSPQGISGVILIAESHLTIHTWPEHAYAAVDFFSCGVLDYQAAFDHMQKEFEAAEISVKTIKRGKLI